MGMHFGILAAETSWATLQEKLLRRGAELRPAGAARDFQQLKKQDPDSFLLVAGDYAGKAYIIDESYEVSVSYPDLVVGLSADIGGRVVGCGAETVSGSFDLYLAEKGALRRFYHQCNMSISRPLQLGSPLACEQKVPYDQLDGAGLIAALGEAGFDYDSFYQKGKHSCYFLGFDNPRLKETNSGPLRQQLISHHEKYKYPEGQAPQSTVVYRGVVQRPSGFRNWLRSFFKK
jgi:hypothetical protein